MTAISNKEDSVSGKSETESTGMRILAFVLLVCFVPALFIGINIAGGIYSFFFPYLDQELSGAVTISPEWTEITPKKPLRVERQIQLIALDIAKPVEPERGKGWGLVLADGSVVTPEVQLVDQDGKIYNLDQPSVLWNPSTGVTLREFSSSGLPKDKVFRSVRIRSAKPVRCNRIFWRNYNMWDVE